MSSIAALLWRFLPCLGPLLTRRPFFFAFSARFSPDRAGECACCSNRGRNLSPPRSYAPENLCHAIWEALFRGRPIRLQLLQRNVGELVRQRHDVGGEAGKRRGALVAPLVHVER